MDTNEIANLLGSQLTDARVETALQRFGITELPCVKIAHLDPDGPVVETQDWVLNSSLGIEFGFDDEASWRGWEECEFGRHPMLLTQIYFYGDHQGVRPYAGTLPFGLRLSDLRDTVRAKLVTLERTRRSYVRDTWEAKDFRITVSYAANGGRIGFVLFILRELPLPSFDYSLATMPTIDSIIELIGSGCNAPRFQKQFAQLGIERYLKDLRDENRINMRSTYGFDLGFNRSVFDKWPASDASGPIFSYVVFYRERELDSRGWNGALPFGLIFDDSLETAVKKIGCSADERADTQFDGYALWHFSNYSLHIYYSTMENVILRVRLMAPGLWTSWQAV